MGRNSGKIGYDRTVGVLFDRTIIPSFDQIDILSSLDLCFMRSQSPVASHSKDGLQPLTIDLADQMLDPIARDDHHPFGIRCDS